MGSQQEVEQEAAPAQLSEWGQTFYMGDTLVDTNTASTTTPSSMGMMKMHQEEEQRPLNMDFEHALESDLTLNAMLSQTIEQEDDADNDFAQLLDSVISW